MSAARERLKHIYKATAFFEDGDHEDPRNHPFVRILLVGEIVGPQLLEELYDIIIDHKAKKALVLSIK